MVQLFASYPRALVELALHPVEGLPGKCEFIPSIATAKRFLDERLEQQRAEEYRRRQSVKQIEPPIDPAMRDRVGRMFSELSARLKQTA